VTNRYHAIRDDDAGQINAIAECASFNPCDAVWNCDASQAGSVESSFTDTGDTVWNCDVSQACATGECIIWNARNTCPNRYTIKSRATLKYPVSDTSHAVWDCNSGQAGAT
jgi:hypothetical protein